MNLLRGLAFTLALLLAAPAWGQAGFLSKGRKTTVRLVLSHEVAKPGDTVLAGVELTMDPGWHTYWQNPGDSGVATGIHWAPAAGVTPGVIQWPVPEKFAADELLTYVFHERAVLLVPLTIAADAAVGPRELRSLVDWLECEVACVPGSNMVSATLTIGGESKPGADADFFKQAQARLPKSPLPGTATARWESPTPTNRPFVIEWTAEAAGPDFFAFTNEAATIAARTEVVSATAGKIVLRKFAEKLSNAWPREVSGLLVRQENGANVGYETRLPISEPAGAAASAAGSATQPPKAFWALLLYAFLGGMILNIMPCVLPVIALKILGFVHQSREHPRRVRTLGLLYTLGVLVSFLVLAGIIIAIREAGGRAGWGLQFSNPQFIVVLTVLVTLVALNLFGVFEITLSGRALDVAGDAASRHGNAGAFMNGVLATVLATPCTAPFLGAAAGFALAPKQSAWTTLLIFLTIGAGMAAPYLLLSWNPKWLRLLPKPGAWMERFKVAMGFPMLVTAVWLFSLTITHYGGGVVWLGVFLILVALAAWVFGEFVQRARTRRGLATVVVLALLAAGYAIALEKELHWRAPVAEAASPDTIRESADGILWHRWSPEAVAKARAEGRPVFVDFTADWCLTCRLNKKSSIEVASVRAKLTEINAVALLGDHTKFPPAISAELEKFQRAGVPLVLVYPKDESKPPIVLPELLTPGIVIKALDEAAR